MNVELGVSLKRGWEYLRIGRKLRLLPTTTALFRAGKLSWSKVRLIASVASKENENGVKARIYAAELVKIDDDQMATIA